MKNMSICRLAEDPRFKIKVSVDKEISKLSYLNVLTGTECENPDSVIQSTLKNKEINDKWSCLIESVKQDKRLYYKVLEGMQVIEY